MDFIRINDSEEYLYQESMMRTYLNLCLIVLQVTSKQQKQIQVTNQIQQPEDETSRCRLQLNKQTYDSLIHIFEKRNICQVYPQFAQNIYQSQDFLHQIFSDINSSSDQVQLSSLQLIKILMKVDDSACVLFSKMKLLSNIIKKFILEESDSSG